ncbi:MAG: NUDIX hydrolase N-terminal domain-containing protein [Anaerolineales bacterium]|nr:NUDIX hydrolase N-terminal domain-containing protein [Anaerolineales bacterium]
MPQTFYQIADKLRAIANMGLRYAQDEYDVERYQKILLASAEIVAALEQGSPEEVLENYQDDLDHISPHAGAEAALFRDGKLLLIQRRDSKKWAIPGGLVDIGETLAQAAQRELEEETGLCGTPTRLLGIFDSLRWKAALRRQLYLAVFQVEVSGGNPVRTSEALDAAFFGEDELPPLDTWHQYRVPVVFKLYRGEIPVPLFDL